MMILRNFARALAVTLCMLVVGGAYVWHRTILNQAVDNAEARGKSIAQESIRRRREGELARIMAQAAADSARTEHSRMLMKELANDASINDDCYVPGDALRLLDAVGTKPGASP